jgi:hypothetical protein
MNGYAIVMSADRTMTTALPINGEAFNSNLAQTSIDFLADVDTTTYPPNPFAQLTWLADENKWMPYDSTALQLRTVGYMSTTGPVDLGDGPFMSIIQPNGDVEATTPASFDEGETILTLADGSIAIYTIVSGAFSDPIGAETGFYQATATDNAMWGFAYVGISGLSHILFTPTIEV